MIRKWICMLMAVLLLIPAAAGLADSAPAATMNYLYTFFPGDILEGEGTEMITELMDAVQIRFIRQKTEGENLVRLSILSEGSEAFTMTATEKSGEEFTITCSLLGSNMLSLRREQLPSFLHTLVQMLEDSGLVKGESADQMHQLADRGAGLLEDYLNREPDSAPDTGIDLTPYLKILAGASSETTMREIPAEEQDEFGAVSVSTYLLNQEQRQKLVDLAMNKLLSIPVLGDQLKNGKLRIGKQVITDQFVRTMFAETPGEVALDVYLDGQGQLVRMVAHTPGLSELVEDPQFAKTEGVDISIVRKREGDHLTSVTTIRLIGLDGTLMTARLDRTPGEPVKPVKVKHIHQVGEMDSAQLMKLVRNMSITIAKNGMNMLLDLPRCVMDLLMDKLLHR